ncbi:PqiC family protein [Aestuariirhabdus sp. LZHN29]|uniref:PqiC family protein n=1 Tax=Aestuariirhabdus sp. LZHN29 TaxID=3417462 RepID=UPI003CED37C4
MRVLVVFLVSILLGGCLSTPTSSSHYLLRSDAQLSDSAMATGTGVILVSVDVATYIDQDGLVLESEEGEIQTADYHLWAEPLRHSLMQFMANEVSASSGKPVGNGLQAASVGTQRLLIEIDQLHGTKNGDAVLVAYWQLTQGSGEDKQRSNYSWSGSRPLSEDGYAALVAAEKQLLIDLAREIGATL